MSPGPADPGRPPEEDRAPGEPAGPPAADAVEPTRADSTPADSTSTGSVRAPAPSPAVAADVPGDPVPPVSLATRPPSAVRIHHPFMLGFFGGLGAALAFWLGSLAQSIASVVLLVVVAFFLAAGLNPGVEYFVRRGMRRGFALLVVTGIFLLGLTLFVVALVPVIADQAGGITRSAPGWLDTLQGNDLVQRLDEQFDIVGKARDYVESGDWASSLFGGVVGIGLAVVSAVANGFILLILTLYILASLPAMKSALYRFAPASRRPRVQELGDRIIRNIGAYVSGAFLVATCAGITSAIFLLVVGLGEYAIALALVVALLDLIPMIGATIGAVVVSAIAFATDPWTGLVTVGFYVVYQQVENYLIYPRVMSRAVDISGALIVIAALVGATLLGVVGALLAIPTAAALQLLAQELVLKRQDVR